MNRQPWVDGWDGVELRKIFYTLFLTGIMLVLQLPSGKRELQNFFLLGDFKFAKCFGQIGL